MDNGTMSGPSPAVIEGIRVDTGDGFADNPTGIQHHFPPLLPVASARSRYTRGRVSL
jgi:hypothetical protein